MLGLGAESNNYTSNCNGYEKQVYLTDDINKMNKSDFQRSFDIIINKEFEAPKPDEIASIKKLDNSNFNSIIDSSIENELKRLGFPDTDTIRKNTALKVYYWLNKYFKDVLEKSDTTVLYRAKLGKYEFYTLYILSKLGITVYVVSNSIRNLSLTGYKNIHIKIWNTNENLAISSGIKTLTELSERIQQNKYVSIKILGCSSDKAIELNNFIYSIKSKAVLIEDALQKPSPDDIAKLTSKSDLTIEDVVGSYIGNQKEEIIDCIKDYFENSNISSKSIRINKSITVVFQLNKLLNIRKEKGGANYVVIKTSEINSSYELFIRLLIRLNLSLIVICTDREKCKINLDFIEGIDLGEDNPSWVYEDRFIDIRNTVAFGAKQEIDEKLFNGNVQGLYREGQFRNGIIHSIPLKSTYDEVRIYWSEEVQFRPYFKTTRSEVDLPILFAKISGFNGTVEQYKEEISKFITENTILYLNSTENKDATILCNAALHKMIYNHKLDVDNIMKHKEYRYGFLNIDCQYFLLNKIQELLDCGIIDQSNIDRISFENKTLQVLLNIETRVLNLIQWFITLPTGKSPKVIFIHQNTETKIEDSIMIAFLSLVGFDILLAVPTMYNSIDSYISKGIVQEHILGKPLFNTDIQSLEDLNKVKNVKFGSLVESLIDTFKPFKA